MYLLFEILFGGICLEFIVYLYEKILLRMYICSIVENGKK